jgi:hypothetical protein
MTDVAKRLESLIAELGTLGSPIGRYLSPGRTEADVRAALNGLDLAPPAELIDWYTSHDGVDHVAHRSGIPVLPDQLQQSARLVGTLQAEPQTSTQPAVVHRVERGGSIPVRELGERLVDGVRKRARVGPRIAAFAGHRALLPRAG